MLCYELWCYICYLAYLLVPPIVFRLAHKAFDLKVEWYRSIFVLTVNFVVKKQRNNSKTFSSSKRILYAEHENALKLFPLTGCGDLEWDQLCIHTKIVHIVFWIFCFNKYVSIQKNRWKFLLLTTEFIRQKNILYSKLMWKNLVQIKQKKEL